MFKKFFAFLLSVFLFVFALVPASAAGNDSYVQNLGVSSWWDRNQMTAYVTSSSDFKTYTYGDANFDCWVGTPQYQFYPSDTGFTRSDVFYGFHLSKFLNFSSSSASFSYSFDIPSFAFASVNMPTKFGFFICNKYTLDKILWLYLGGGYKTGSIFECAELYYLNSSAAVAEDPRLHVYAYNFVSYTSSGFVVSGDCVTDSYASDLVCVLGSFSDGKLRNYSYLPTSINIRPYGNTLQQLLDNQFRSNIESAINGEGESYSSVDNSKLGEYESLESDLNKDFSGDLSNSLNNGIFTSSGAFAFIRDIFEDVILSNPIILGLMLFALSMGLVALILGRKVGS